MTRGRARRALSWFLAVTVVLVVVYAAAAIISPVPRLVIDAQLPERDTGSPWSDSITLPTNGSTAIDVAKAEPVLAGVDTSRPIAGAAKLVLLAVALDAESLPPGGVGPATTIDQAAVDRYRALAAAGARTVPVAFGQTWTRRDLIAATLLGSGNNIAELLITQQFGDLTGYLSAASVWLDDHGFTTTSVADGAGLDPDSRSSAAELAAITRTLLEHPVITELLDARPLTTSTGVTYTDEASFVPELGASGLVRSYTDAAGVCIVSTITVGDETVVTVLLGQPSYPAADDAITGLIDGLQSAITTVEVISAGEVVAIARSDWGQETEIVATEAVTVSSTAVERLELRVEAELRSTLARGATAGRLVAVLTQADGTTIEQGVRLEASGSITEPGIAWRFGDPLSVLNRWLG